MNRSPRLLLGLVITCLLLVAVSNLLSNRAAPSFVDVLASHVSADHDWDTNSFTDRPLDRNLYHLINQRSMFAGSGCTGTAIARHALLTASHCESPTQDLIMDGYAVNIVSTLRDGHDHSIYLLSNATFGSVAQLDPNSLHRGDPVHFFGIAGAADPLRRGRFTRYTPQSKYYDYTWGWSTLGDHKDFEEFDLHCIPGDSGSGLINHKGKLVAVISASDGSITLALPLSFTSQQWKEAQDYAPPSSNSKVTVSYGNGNVVDVTLSYVAAGAKDPPASADSAQRYRQRRKGHAKAR